MGNPLWAIIKRDWLLTLRQPVTLLIPVLFSLLVASLFPLALGSGGEKLRLVAPAILIMITLLACLMATDGLYREDFDDGSLVLMMLSPQSTYFLHMAKVAIYWVSSGCVISFTAPLIGLLLNLPSNSCLDILFTLMLGSLALIYLGAIGAALTVGLKNTGLLLVFIILPLYVPVLILASAAIQASVQGLASVDNYLAMLAALAILSVVLAPLAISGALKINIEAN